ncbi:WD repeat and FYVE domain-containing protein 2 [Paramecium bursaria]
MHQVILFSCLRVEYTQQINVDHIQIVVCQKYLFYSQQITSRIAHINQSQMIEVQNEKISIEIQPQGQSQIDLNTFQAFSLEKVPVYQNKQLIGFLCFKIELKPQKLDASINFGSNLFTIAIEQNKISVDELRTQFKSIQQEYQQNIQQNQQVDYQIRQLQEQLKQLNEKENELDNKLQKLQSRAPQLQILLNEKLQNQYKIMTFNKKNYIPTPTNIQSSKEPEIPLTMSIPFIYIKIDIWNKIFVGIPSYKTFEKGAENEIVLFLIDINIVSVVPYRVEKRYSDLYDFDTILQSQFKYLNKIPGKTLLKIKESTKIDKRRIKLERYLQDLCKRMDVFSSAIFAEFFDFKTFAPQFIYEPFLQKYKLQGPSFIVRDFKLSNDENSIILVSAQKNPIKQVDAFFRNRDKLTTTLGSVELYVFTETGLKQKWKRDYAFNIFCMCWEEMNELLLLGLENGTIEHIQLNNQEIKEVRSFQQHESRINGVYIDKRINLIHSISKDFFYKIFSADQPSKQYNLNLKEELWAITVCDTRYISIIGSKKGTIQIFDISQGEPKLLSKLNISVRNWIRQISIDPKGYAFIACQEGSLQIIEIGKPGKEKYSKLNIQVRTNPDTRCVEFVDQNRFILIGDQEGFIQIYSAVTGLPLYSYKASENAINKITQIQSQGMLMIATENTITFWLIPKSWPNLNQLKEIEYLEVRNQTIKEQKQIVKNEYDSDDEELDGWHRKYK